MMFCNYNFMLNEAPNNNDIASIANSMLNKVSNSNDITCVGNNVHLTAIGAQQFSVATI